MTKKTFILFLAIGLNFPVLFSQRGDEYFSRELTAGASLSTVGGLIGALSLDYNRKITTKQAHAFSFEIAEIKHAKEQRYTSTQTGQFFIFGKQNHLLPFRFLYGRELYLFKKNPDEGIRLSTKLMGGPSFGLVKPYYVEYDFSKNSDTTDIAIVPYDPNSIDPYRVRSGGYLFRGFGNSQLLLGLHLKASLNFEISPYVKANADNSRIPRAISGIETGFAVDIYSKQIDILAFDFNKSIYPSFFIKIYYGSRW